MALSFIRSRHKILRTSGHLSRKCPQAARSLLEDILYAIRGLLPFPNQGHRRPDLTSRPLRFITVYEYLIAYAPDEDPLWIIAVMQGRRSPRVMAAILRGRE